MRIKVVILDQDENYKNRLINNFQIKYADKLELYTFSVNEHLYENLSASKADIVLLDAEMNISVNDIPKDQIVVYLSKTMDIEELEGIPAICKFQKIEMIYKQILGIYAETASNMKLKSGSASGRILLFISAQGGSGTSSAAASYALRCANKGKKVFYLNLELLGGTDLYFNGDGLMSFSDVIYALKSKNSNLRIKMESALKTDKSGVEFFDTCKNAYDMTELSNEEIKDLISGISQIKEYEDIVIDLSGGISERMLMLMKDFADRIICVNDGSKTGNSKFERFCEIYSVLEKRLETAFLNKMVLLYNRYSSRTSNQLSQSPVQVLGGINRYEGVSGRELIEEIAKLPVFDQI